jgi:hypothetical protein
LPAAGRIRRVVAQPCGASVDPVDAAIGLLASPLLGPASWEPVALALRARGFEVTVVAHVGPPPGSARSVVDAFVAGLGADQDWVLIPHSNAGLLAPAVARARRVRGIVYVDARLPEPGLRPMKSPPSLAFLAAKADSSGVLPPWSEWWDGDVSHLFPTPAVRRACEAQMRRLPLSYYEDHVDGTGCDRTPSAYLAFGDGYADERERAAAAGWPSVTVEDAHHLHMLVDPDGVAAQVDALIAAIGVPLSAAGKDPRRRLPR